MIGSRWSHGVAIILGDEGEKQAVPGDSAWCQAAESCRPKEEVLRCLKISGSGMSRTGHMGPRDDRQPMSLSKMGFACLSRYTES